MVARRGPGEYAAESAVLAEVARALHRATSASDAVQRAAEALQRHFATHSLAILLKGADPESIGLEGLALADPQASELAETIAELYGTVPLGSARSAAVAIRTRSPVRVSTADPDLDPHLRGILAAAGAGGLITLPIFLDDVAVGAVAVATAEGEGLTPSEQDLLQNAIGLLAIVHQRAMLEEREQERSVRLRTLDLAIEHLPLIIKVMSPDWVFLWCNPATRRILGYAPEDLEGRSVREIRADGAAADAQRDIERTVARGEPWSGEVVEVTRDGVPVPMQATVVPVRSASGALVSVVEIERDLREDKARQERAVAAYRLAAVGELAAGVAHEVNNPLQAISATAELLLMEALPERVRSDVEAVRAEAKRGGAIVRNLLAFARPKEPEKTTLHLGDLVASVVEVRRPQLHLASVDVDMEVDPSTGPVLVDPDHVKQVVHNLLSNARQAIQSVAEEGRVRIVVRPRGDTAELVVEDTGPGVADDVAKKIFRPFFTTKGPEGTGLGLSLSQRLIEDHGGDIHVENWGRPAVAGGRPGEGGARFVVRLPRTEEEARRPVVAEPGLATPPPRAVLIIDDEPVIADAVRRFLDRSGYRAEVVHNAEAGLERITGHTRFDAILVDLRMPGMGGEGFYRAILNERPDLVEALVFTSGDVMTPATQAFLEGTGRPVLAKPYELQRLVELIAEL